MGPRGQRSSFGIYIRKLAFLSQIGRLIFASTCRPYTDFYKWSIIRQDGKLAISLNVFTSSDFKSKTDFIFRSTESQAIATAIEFYIEKCVVAPFEFCVGGLSFATRPAQVHDTHAFASRARGVSRPTEAHGSRDPSCRRRVGTEGTKAPRIRPARPPGHLGESVAISQLSVCLLLTGAC